MPSSINDSSCEDCSENYFGEKVAWKVRKKTF